MAPTNTTPATAITILALPYSLVQDMQGAATGTYVADCVGDAQLPGWWTYTTGPSESVFGVRAVTTGDYEAGVSVWTGTPPALTQPDNQCVSAGDDSWLVVVGAPSTKYYLQVSTAVPGTVTSPLTFSAVAAPNVLAPAGSMYIFNDNDPGIAGVIISQTDGAILRALSTVPCEFGAVAYTSGVVCIGAAVLGTLYLQSIQIYDDQLLTTIADLPSLVIPDQSWLSPVAHDYDETFYIFQIPRSEVPLTSPVVVVSVSEDGIAGDTLTLPSNLGQINGAAISRDGSILYYATMDGSGQTIRRHDIATDLPLSDLVSFTGRAFQYDLAVCPNGDVLIPYHLNASATTMRVDRYSDAGVFQVTYNCGTSTGGVPRMAIAFDDLSFWAMTFVSSGFTTYNRFQQIVLTSSAVATTFDVRNSTGTQPVGEFFTPSTCPLLVLRQAVTAIPVEPLVVECPPDHLGLVGVAYASSASATGGVPPYVFSIVSGIVPPGLSLDADTGLIDGTPTTVGVYPFTLRATDDDSTTDNALCSITIAEGVTSPICRKIRFPLPFNQNMLTFLYRLEFLIQSGVSPNASITVNLSRDGGYTWPITRTLTAGALGAYDWRVYTTNMGQGRNWVCEFVTEAPYFWALIQCYADMEAGTS